MRRLIIAMLIAVVGLTVEAKTKQAAKPAAAAKKGAEDSVVTIGQLTKDSGGGKDVFTLAKDGGEKIVVSESAAKRMSINLNDFVGKKVAIDGACDAKKGITSIRFVKTDADYKKQGGK